MVITPKSVYYSINYISRHSVTPAQAGIQTAGPLPALATSDPTVEVDMARSPACAGVTTRAMPLT